MKPLATSFYRFLKLPIQVTINRKREFGSCKRKASWVLKSMRPENFKSILFQGGHCIADALNSLYQ
jgi:hypothetical protein